MADQVQVIRVDAFGGPDVLKLRRVAPPLPGPGCVRVRLEASGVNFIDIYQRRGELPLSLPFTPGREGAGVVDSLGEGVTQVGLSDRVAFYGQYGAYGEVAIVPADRLIQLPPGVSFEQAAAVTLQGMTAHYLLHDFVPLGPDKTVLVHAAAGGVGLLAVQWAKRLGARVLGTVSTEAKAAAALAAGADHVIRYDRDDFVAETMRLTGGVGAQLILDGVGGKTFAGSLAAAAVRGTVVVFGMASGPAAPIVATALIERSVIVAGGGLYNFVDSRADLERRAAAVYGGVAAGWLTPRLFRVLPLSAVAEGHALLESRVTIGKIVLSMR